MSFEYEETSVSVTVVVKPVLRRWHKFGAFVSLGTRKCDGDQQQEHAKGLHQHEESRFCEVCERPYEQMWTPGSQNSRNLASWPCSDLSRYTTYYDDSGMVASVTEGRQNSWRPIQTSSSWRHDELEGHRWGCKVLIVVARDDL